MTLAHKTISGTIWSFIEQFGRRGVNFIVTLLLAHFLIPSDFGLVAMMAVFLAIGTSLMNSGFKQALIRLQNANQMDFCTAFYANLILGLLSYLLIFLFAPLIAKFYEETRLISLIRVSALAIPVNSFQMVQSAILNRKLDYKLQLQATIPANVISGLLAVGIAYLGVGVWALIVQMLIGSFITTILLWILQGWRPNLKFSHESLRSMYDFGYKIFLAGFLNIVFTNLYVIVIAKMFTTTIAGQYFFANKIKNIFTDQLMGSIQNVTYSSLSTLQNDKTRLKVGYRKVIQITTFVYFPIILLFASVVDPLFHIMLNEKWWSAIPYLQLLCIAGLLYPIHVINLNVLQVKGRSDLFLYLEIYKKSILAIVLVISFRFGIFGILIGQIIVSILAYIPNGWFSSRLIDYSIQEQLADFVPNLLLSGVIALTFYSCRVLIHLPAIWELTFLPILGGVIYIAVAYYFKLSGFRLTKEIVFDFLLRKIKEHNNKTSLIK